MNLPEPSGWVEHDPKAIGEYLGSLIESVITEFRDESNATIERLQRELDEAHARIEDLLPKMDASGSLVREEF